MLIEVPEKVEQVSTFNETIVTVVEEKDDSSVPGFTIELTYIGELRIFFTQAMTKVEDLSQLNQTVLELILELDESNFIEDPSLVDFTWEVISFEERLLVIQVTFARPSYISSGLSRDRFRATVKDSTYFVSAESLKAIPVETTYALSKVPKMMPNNEFTKIFVRASQGFGNFANLSFCGNFVINLFLSGAMNTLWGMVNAMQIIAHFPLINIMMPSNAQIVFNVIVEIATFDIIPTEPLIESAEDDMGLIRKEYILTDNFEEFGFDSSDPVRNLQIMFLFILFLILFPLLSLLCKGLCFWSEKCLRWRTFLNRAMFFNTYIRFSLETFLELSISSLIRCKAWDFEDSSEKFYSIFSVIIMVFIVFMIFFTAIFPQTSFGKFEDPSWKQKYGALTDGLQTHNRSALAQPHLFIIRRCCYALLVVFWVDRSYFQV